MNAYLHPNIARALLAQSRAFTAAKRIERETQARQVREFNEAAAQCVRLGWDEAAARELAAIKVYGVAQ